MDESPKVLVGISVAHSIRDRRRHMTNARDVARKRESRGHWGSPACVVAGYIESLDALSREECRKVVLYARVSVTGGRYGKDAEKSLVRQLEVMRRKLAGLGIRVVREYSEEVTARLGADCMPQFLDACMFARGRFPIVAESADRFLRSYHFSKDKWTPPTVSECEALKQVSSGVRLITLMPPDATLRTVHGEKSRQGQRRADKLIGRPPKPYRRARSDEIEMAKRLRSEGRSLREIGRAMKRPHSTVQGWLNGSV